MPVTPNKYGIPPTKRETLGVSLRAKPKDLAAIRKVLLDEQGWLCPLCQRDLHYVLPKHRCVDHSHDKTGLAAGAIRGVMCSNCNGNEGRIRRRVVCSKGSLTEIEWLENLLNYLKKHAVNQTGLIHPRHKTPDELRLATNAKARARRRTVKGI